VAIRDEPRRESSCETRPRNDGVHLDAREAAKERNRVASGVHMHIVTLRAERWNQR
jgi:hypothetical protein